MGWLALIAALLGTGLQVAGNVKSQREMERKVRQELLRQKGYADSANQLLQQSMTESKPENVQKQISSDTAERANMYDQANQTVFTDNSVKASNPAQKVQNQVTMGQQKKAQAEFMGNDAYLIKQLLRNAAINSRLNTLSGLSGTSAGVLGSDLQLAARKGDNLKQAGQLVGLAGMLSGYKPS